MLKNLEPGTIVYTTNEGLIGFEKNDMNNHVIKTFDEFNVTLIKLEFLNPATRVKAIKKDI